MTNILLSTDSYKMSHWLGYPSGTEVVNSYIEARGGKYDKSVFFGLQYFIKNYLSGQVVTREKIEEAAEIAQAHGEPFNREGWEYILNEHGGNLPLEIEAVPEGTVMNVSNVLVQIRNTDPKVFWLTSYAETAILRAVWYGTTVASKSYKCKQIMKKYLEKTSDNPDHISFMLHDFGARGVSSTESASIGGAAHLVNFMGTDTLEGLMMLRRNYGADIAGFSVPAAEHSTMTTWGGEEGEIEAFKNMLTQYKGYPIVSVVSDSYNYWEAISKKWPSLKFHIDEFGGKLVIRPDSGNPVAVVSNSLRVLGEKFGYTLNSKGYKKLPDNIGVIQGDGVNEDSIKEILEEITQQGWAADNVVFGMGGGLLQDLTRDTMKFAMKCSAIRINGEWHDVQKNPIGDSSKASKGGILSLSRNDETGELVTVRRDSVHRENNLIPVFRNGELLVDQSLEEIRKRANV